VIEHVVDKKKPFKDGYFFWRFTQDFMQNARLPVSRPQPKVSADRSAL